MSRQPPAQLLVNNRSNGRGCPQCTGQKLCKHNSLATKSPLVAAEWHPTKNAFSPEDVTASSKKLLVWQCQACRHEWTTSVNARTAKNRGCPRCNTGLLGRTKKHHPTLADSKYSLLAEWDHSRNAALGIFPDNITLGSKKQTFWLCPHCPAGQQHSYSAMLMSRTARRPTGCSMCAGHKACKCNSLQTHYPQLVSEWDFAKNQGTPDDHSAHSTFMAWWTSDKQGSWQQSIAQRAQSVKLERQRRLIRESHL